jgi:HSP20 family protein
MINEAVTWIPPVDVYEIDDNYVLHAELPGVEPGDIKMEFSGSEFTIKGERQLDTLCPKESYQRLEMQRGRFHRTFSLPDPVDKNRIQWELKDGVLHVVLPKSSQTKNRLQGNGR